MNTRKSFLMVAFLVVFVLLLLTTHSAYAAPIINFPVTVTQPDGESLSLFTSGDEYYHRLHDEAGYTIVQHPDSGYYVYADLVNGELVPTEYVAGKVDPASVGLVPNLSLSPEKIEERRQERIQQTVSGMDTVSAQNTPTSGTINNLVVFIRFSDETEFTNLLSDYEGWFNDDPYSMRNYYQEASYNALTIDSTFYPVPSETAVVSYQDSHPRGYYRPYNAGTNEIGYKETDDDVLREQTLLRNAIEYVKASGQFPGGATIDGNGDGAVDSVNFVLRGGPDGGGNLLWPHMNGLYKYYVTINGKRVWDYSLVFEQTVGLEHEMFHILGAPDLYHYTDDGNVPVGMWDLMEYDLYPPQHMGCYMKYRYGHWINEIPEITVPGTYTLNPLTASTGNCFQTASPYSTTESFVVEYRSPVPGTFEEVALYNSGLLVYRINSAQDGQGNADGPPDEVYIYRPNNSNEIADLLNAPLSSDHGRTELNDQTNPSGFLSNGDPGGLSICNIGSEGDTISFDYGNCTDLTVSPETWTFAEQPVGSSSEAKTFTITNTGSGSITLGNLGTSGDFVLSNDWCSGQILGASGTCTFDVTFSPTLDDLRSGSVSIPSDHPNSPDAISLNGMGKPIVHCASVQNPDEYISRVQLKNGNQASSRAGYQDFTGPSFTGLNPGASYPVYVTGTMPYLTAYQDFVKVWVDFNQDFDFTDAGEGLDLGSYTYAGNHVFTGNLVVPNDALLGQTRMRVTLTFESVPGPCTNGEYGETEDYTLTITDAALPPAERLTNGGFNTYIGKSKIPSGWVKTGFASTDGKDTRVRKEGQASVKMVGNGKSKTLSQTLILNGQAGDAFTFSYWVKGSGLPRSGTCQAQVKFYNNSVLVGTQTRKCPNSSTYSWKKMASIFLAPANYDKITVKFTVKKSIGTLWLDWASLLR